MKVEVAKKQLTDLFGEEYKNRTSGYWGSDYDRQLCGFPIHRTPKGYSTLYFLVADDTLRGGSIRDISTQVATLVPHTEFDRKRGGCRVKVAFVNPTAWVAEKLTEILGIHIQPNSGG